MGIYRIYDDKHQHPVNRALHMIAIPLGFSAPVVAFWNWKLALLQVPAAFALAWIGHAIEGNQPAFFKNPGQVLMVAPLWMARRLFRRP